MHKTLAALLLLLGLTPANAQIISMRLPMKLPTPIGNIPPVIMPGTAVIPISLPTVDAEILIPVIPRIAPYTTPAIIPMSLPARAMPEILPMRLPGVPSPLPLPTPVVLATAVAIHDLRAVALSHGKFD